jgi:hypothetical protein
MEIKVVDVVWDVNGINSFEEWINKVIEQNDIHPGDIINIAHVSTFCSNLGNFESWRIIYRV